MLAAICRAAPLLAGGPPLAGFGAWLAGTGLVMLPLMIADPGVVAWNIHHRQTKTVGSGTKNHKEGARP